MGKTKSKESSDQKAEGKKSGKIKEFRLYAPDAEEAYLAGEFNNWDTKALPLKRWKNGIWHGGTWKNGIWRFWS